MFNVLLNQAVDAINDLIERPWGKFIVLDTCFDKDTLIHKQKLLIIKPNSEIQLHSHAHYTELWIGETVFDYILEDENGALQQGTAKPFERVFVPTNRKHKIISKDTEVRIFEVQTGTISEEDNTKFD